MAHQTAVEWFYQRILAEDIKEVFEQAKEMEKEQIIESFILGNAWILPEDEDINQISKQYYNETYGK